MLDLGGSRRLMILGLLSARLLKFILAEVEIVERLVSIRLTPILLDFEIEIFLRNPGVFLRSLLVPENYQIRLKVYSLPTPC